MPPPAVLLALATACFSGGCLAVVPPSPQVSFSLVKWHAGQVELTKKNAIYRITVEVRGGGEGNCVSVGTSAKKSSLFCSIPSYLVFLIPHFVTISFSFMIIDVVPFF